MKRFALTLALGFFLGFEVGSFWAFIRPDQFRRWNPLGGYTIGGPDHVEGK